MRFSDIPWSSGLVAYFCYIAVIVSCKSVTYIYVVCVWYVCVYDFQY